MGEFRHEVKREGSSVHVTMAGVMNGPEAALAIGAFERTVPAEGPFVLHVHLGDLDRYEPDARRAWMEALGRHRDRCLRIVLHRAKPLVRMAAATVALVLRMPMDFTDE